MKKHLKYNKDGLSPLIFAPPECMDYQKIPDPQF
ncbi:hypothetical protein HDE69_003435 [Pedobacter cryoconitis]|uniref:Uncharacterized protein n=1 Tax=Pedobacter cryoconitis TaxID=188932 RepID=A0A7W9DLN0_9SPHI|nr:hypothetical protein [Pedobacter cryoconitis]MBB5647513.1 hypothetical protein [Pedobacter cryoconitis]